MRFVLLVVVFADQEDQFPHKTQVKFSETLASWKVKLFDDWSALLIGERRVIFVSLWTESIEKFDWETIWGASAIKKKEKRTMKMREETRRQRPAILKNAVLDENNLDSCL